jgi:hypothetical protein
MGNGHILVPRFYLGMPFCRLCRLCGVFSLFSFPGSTWECHFVGSADCAESFSPVSSF